MIDLVTDQCIVVPAGIVLPVLLVTTARNGIGLGNPTPVEVSNHSHLRLTMVLIGFGLGSAFPGWLCTKRLGAG